MEAETKSNLADAAKEIKALQRMIKKAGSAIKRYRKDIDGCSSVEYSFEWHSLRIVEATQLKNTASSGIVCIAYQGKEAHKKNLLAEVLRMAETPSRSTSPTANLVHQESLSVAAYVYSKLYHRSC